MSSFFLLPTQVLKEIPKQRVTQIRAALNMQPLNYSFCQVADPWKQFELITIVK